MNTFALRAGSPLIPLAVLATILVALAAIILAGDAFTAASDLTGLVEAGRARP